MIAASSAAKSSKGPWSELPPCLGADDAGPSRSPEARTESHGQDPVANLDPVGIAQLGDLKEALPSSSLEHGEVGLLVHHR